MIEVMEGRMHPMSSDPEALDEATRAIVLVPFAMVSALTLGQIAYLAGQTLGYYIVKGF